jgi:hypothetical protein
MEFLPYRNTGHAFGVEVNGDLYYYFTSPSPMGARLRVRAQWDNVIDPNRYEALTALVSDNRKPKSGNRNQKSKLRRPFSDSRWVTFAEIIASQNKSKADIIEALEQEAKDVRVYDIESGKTILPHNGTVYFNAFRKRWIGIFVQQFGEPSNLGEVWYAEADTPIGPWAYAQKVITHDKYSFYNPKQHPFFDQEGGRVIFFEGTYSYTFSGPAENATPRYDYNQLMYRLNLDDPRLVLPVAVYQVTDEQTGRNYLLRDGAEKADRWNAIESIPFFAVEPGRTPGHLIPIYAQKIPADTKRIVRLTAERPATTVSPLFYALPPDDSANEKPHIVSLYEYRHLETAQYRYSTDPASRQKGWIRKGHPLCRVWKAPLAPLLLDRKAKPVRGSL